MIRRLFPLFVLTLAACYPTFPEEWLQRGPRLDSDIAPDSSASDADAEHSDLDARGDVPTLDASEDRVDMLPREDAPDAIRPDSDLDASAPSDAGSDVRPIGDSDLDMPPLGDLGPLSDQSTDVVPAQDVGVDQLVDATPDGRLDASEDEGTSFDMCPVGADLCDGVDNDCDGQIDEGPQDLAPCTVGLGACSSTGRFACVGGEVLCNAEPREPVNEICDLIDNDCDGSSDEDFDLDSCGVGQLAVSDAEAPHLCIVFPSGRLECRGEQTDGRTMGPEQALELIAAGSNFTCGVLREAGNITCWGNDDNGQVSGHPEGGGFTEIAAGGRTACAVGDNGPICWGRDLDGQASPPDVALTMIRLGPRFACGIRVEEPGGVECWGAIPQDIDDRRDEWSAADRAWALAVGDSHICILEGDDGEPRCWGAEVFHIPPAQGQGFVDIVAGQQFTCGYRADSTTTCWGFLQWPGIRLTTIEAGASRLCGLDARLQLGCWPDDEPFR